MRRAAILLRLLLLASVLASCSGGRWSEEWEQRYETIQPSETVMDLMGIRPGMVVGEIGAGNGRLAVRVAARVGPRGTVYANDIDPRALRFMRERAARDGIDNLVVVRGEEVDPRFPAGGLDLVYVINTYEHLADPVTLLRNTAGCLEPEGRLVIVVHDPDKMKHDRGHAVRSDVVIGQARQAGYELLHTDASLVYDNVYVFRPADGRATPEGG